MRLPIIALLIASSFGSAQMRNLNPNGTNGNILRPGIPLTGAPNSVPQYPAGFGPPQGRAGHRSFSGYGGGYGGGGSIIVPFLSGGGFSSGGGYGGYMVHNPPPGQYDPIFGGYTPPAFPPEAYAVGYPQMPAYAPAPAPAAPTVVINQNFATDPVRPQVRDYSNVQLPEPGVTMAPPAGQDQSAQNQAAPSQLADDQPTVFLIALRDHTILPSIAYWVQGDTLNYVTREGAPNKVSLALVDRDFSRQLNADRKVPFTLPAGR